MKFRATILAATAIPAIIFAMPAPTPPEDQFHGKVRQYSLEIAKIGPGGVGERTLLKSVTKDSEDQVVEEFLLTRWPPEGAEDTPDSLGELTFLNPDSIDRPMLESEHHHFTCDASDRISEDICQYNKEGEKFTERTANSYDAKGQLISEKTYRDGKQIERDVYTYDEKGMLSSEGYVGDPEKLVSSHRYPRAGDPDVVRAPRIREEDEKDERGNVVRRRTYDPSGVLIFDLYANFNEKNVEILSTTLCITATGNDPYKTTSTNDPESNSQTKESENRAGDILSRVVNTRSNNKSEVSEYGYGGKLVKRRVEVAKPEEHYWEHTETDGAEKVTRYSKGWMKDGKLHNLETGSFVGEKFITRWTEYLEADLPLEIEESDASGKCLIHIRLAYDMDERGNWTKITRYDAKGDAKLEPVSVAFRTIEYAR